MQWVEDIKLQWFFLPALRSLSFHEQHSRDRIFPKPPYRANRWFSYHVWSSRGQSPWNISPLPHDYQVDTGTGIPERFFDIKEVCRRTAGLGLGSLESSVQQYGAVITRISIGVVSSRLRDARLEDARMRQGIRIAGEAIRPHYPRATPGSVEIRSC